MIVSPVPGTGFVSAGAPRVAAAAGKPVQPWESGVLALIVVLGAAVRIPIALHSGLWRDEALFLGVAGLPTIHDVFTFLSRHESHPPLFYLLARGWMAVFGGADRSIIWLPLIFGVGLIPLCWWVGRRVFGRGSGLLAAAIVASSQLLALYTASIRPYGFLAVLVVMTTYALWHALITRRTAWWASVAVGSLALVYTHNWSWLVVGAHGLTALLWIAFTPGRRLQLRALGATYGAVVAGFSPWLGVLLYQAAHAGYPLVGHRLWFDTWQVLYVLLGIVPGAGFVLLVLPAGLAVWSGATEARHPPRLRGTGQVCEARLPMLLLTGTAIVPLFVALAAAPMVNVLKPQGFTMVAPCVALALGGLVTVIASPRARAAAWAALGLYVGICAVAAVGASHEVKSNAREIAGVIEERGRAGDLVIQYPGLITSSFNRYFTGDMSQIAYPRFGRSVLVEFDRGYARGMGDEQLGQTLDSLEAVRATGRGVWLIYDADVRLAGPDLPADSAGTSEFYYRARQLFARELWGQLLRRFGPPVWATQPPRGVAFEALGVAYFRPTRRTPH